jgi:hypothetical protein
LQDKSTQKTSVVGKSQGSFQNAISPWAQGRGRDMSKAARDAIAAARTQDDARDAIAAARTQDDARRNRSTSAVWKNSAHRSGQRHGCNQEGPWSDSLQWQQDCCPSLVIFSPRKDTPPRSQRMLQRRRRDHQGTISEPHDTHGKEELGHWCRSCVAPQGLGTSSGSLRQAGATPTTAGGEPWQSGGICRHRQHSTAVDHR